MQVGVEPARVRFGPFELDRNSGELSKFGHKLRLQDQPFQILCLLLERPGEVVTREELQQKLWPSDTFVDFDHGLNNAIKRLREVLHDSAEKPRYIETLPRRGYRFIAVLEPARQESEVVATVPPIKSGSWGTSRWWLVCAAALLLLIGVGTALFLSRRRKPEAPTIRSVAVLPLENVSGDPAQDYFADGITDALTTELAQVSSLRVISRTSAMQYKNPKKALKQIAQELNVDAVVEGSVRRDGDRVWLAAQLIDAAADRHLWAKSYERGLPELTNLQTELARDVIHEVGSGVTSAEETRLSRRIEVNPQAYDLYLRARRFSGLENAEDNQAAIDLLEQSVALDPNSAPTHAALASAYRIKSTILSRNEKQWEEKALASVDRALTLDPNLADAYVARGNLLWTLSNHYPTEKAVQDYRTALRLNPNLSEAHQYLGNVYNHIGLLDRGLAEAQKAAALDPLNTGARFRIGVSLTYQSRYQEALTAFHDSQRFFPALWTFQTSFALFQLGRRDEAAARVNAYVAQSPKDPGGLLTSMQALLAAASGNQVRAEERIRKAIEIGEGYQHFHHTAYLISSSYALMNKPDQSLRYLRMAAEDGFPCYPLFEKDPNLNNLRHDPRFAQFMNDLRIQWEHYKATM